MYNRNTHTHSYINESLYPTFSGVVVSPCPCRVISMSHVRVHAS